VNPGNTPAASRDEAIIRAEVADRLYRTRAEAEANEKAMRAIKRCDMYKHTPSSMDREQAALCYRVWADKANRTLGR
jgi:hypothetical protein